jgi:predicted DNA-binding WGR domain protein
MHRFYQVHVAPGLFKEWLLIREWGRIGSPGTVRKDWFETEAEAVTAGQKIINSK